MTPSKTPAEILDIEGVEVRISSPDKVVFPEPGLTKLDLVRYYLAVAEGALRGAGGRPMVLKRFPKGIDAEPFFQKRVPENHPPFIDTTTLHYASGTSAQEAVIRDAAGLAWVVNLGCLDLNPHPVRAEDLEHPDELRVDLDPMPGVDWSQIVDVAYVAQEVLDDVALVGWPKTSGSRGLHILVRIAPEWSYKDVRLAAETLAREVENRAPGLATARWWKEERGESVFVDFNQNAKDRTVASAYSVRALPDARVSTPLTWDEVRTVRPERFTVPTVLERFADIGDPHAGIDDAVGSLDGLLALAKDLGPAEKAPRAGNGSGRRQSAMPLIEVARTKTKPEALKALEEWKSGHAGVVKALQPADVMVDGMRGSSSLWYRVRVNLQHVPEADRPGQEELIADYDPWAGKEWPGRPGA
ncbi:DNA polymerase LigD, polymerase domain protein [Pseudarthrobacter chlorophenolicus A6]|uniref:DNA polymerase LigD, polymerase domain protein n=1 Tax=Pseudarthrobacter chlorophenolicus (strain ATCC 700700 / DSM 12829 / CIP 107037 / JCM 12360 / KCTC 9906 / NCIMB 13794 / A6) TaxID=452863 RepID=B8HFX4_PSECP|nr:non-homologous end-joining DNA ligase [Pseudarthrobacter chlorophenolicus]ACL41167.1 DNA polymerase LigD, polymerase domain protein [Pseudarthrobacter chlorophenolicus A6]SDQ68875.1 bifunctional non-homologous end joining protein LigD [Pseudarthrobacter chlorophenolicus]